MSPVAGPPGCQVAAHLTWGSEVTGAPGKGSWATGQHFGRWGKLPEGGRLPGQEAERDAHSGEGSKAALHSPGTGQGRGEGRRLRLPAEAARCVSLGSLFTSKAEDSEDDDTEYFDAMEDAESFITVTAEPSEDGWAPGQPLLGWPPPRASGSLHSWFLLSLAPDAGFAYIRLYSSLNQKYPGGFCTGI